MVLEGWSAVEWVSVLDVTRLLFIDGIWLNGLPAPHADCSQAPICPFTSQDSRFTVSTSTFSTIFMRIIVAG